MNATVSNLCNSQVESDNTSSKQPEDKDSCVPNDLVEKNSANEMESGERFNLPPMSRKTSSSKKRRLQDRRAPRSNNRDSIRKKLSLKTEFDVWCQSLVKQPNSMETLRALKLQTQIQKNHYSPGNQPSAS